MRQLLVTLVRSTNGANQKQIDTVQALGLRKIGDQVLQENNKAILGMVAKVNHLVTAEEVEVEEVAE